MSIYNNTSNVNGIYVGSQRCIKAYIGSTLYWEAPKSYASLSILVTYENIPNSGGTVTPYISTRQTWGYYSDTSGGGVNFDLGSITFAKGSGWPSGWTLNTSTGAITASAGSINERNGIVAITATANGWTTSKTVAVTQDGVEITPITTTLTVEPSYLSFGYTANTSTVTVSCPKNSTWTASTSSSWITISPTSGSSGDTSVMIGVSTNSNSSSRSGTVIFASGEERSNLSVVQSANGIKGSIMAEPSVALNSSNLTSQIILSLSDGSSLSASNPIGYMYTVNDWLDVNISYSGGKAVATLAATRSLNAGESNSVAITWAKTSYSSGTTTVTYS
jgi:hypothetical protein